MICYMLCYYKLMENKFPDVRAKAHALYKGMHAPRHLRTKHAPRHTRMRQDTCTTKNGTHPGTHYSFIANYL